MNTTFMANAQNIERKWYVIDATGLRLGKLAAQVAVLLRGKHKPTFTPHVDCGDYVIIVNADKIELSGNKWEDKLYYHHTMYTGGLKVASAKEVHAKKPEKLVELAVKGMLPKGKLGNAMYRKLYVYANETHKHAAQCPVVFEIER